MTGVSARGSTLLPHRTPGRRGPSCPSSVDARWLATEVSVCPEQSPTALATSERSQQLARRITDNTRLSFQRPPVLLGQLTRRWVSVSDEVAPQLVASPTAKLRGLGCDALDLQRTHDVFEEVGMRL